MRPLLPLMLLCLGLPLRAWAFSLSDHTAITKRAMQEFLACAPHALGPQERTGLVRGNLSEDLNMPAKWMTWSHFFHPEKTLVMRRKSSAERIAVLSELIAQEALADFRAPETLFIPDLPMENLGHALHHLQDMASPPHVVPVMHSLSDGFEGLHVELPPVVEGCDFMAAGAGRPLPEILLATARWTLERVRPGGAEAVELREDGLPAKVWWNAFWQETSKNEFGEYGFLGNNFGEESFEHGGLSYTVPPAAYVAFKQRQLRHAIDATKLGLARALRLRLH